MRAQSEIVSGYDIQVAGSLEALFITCADSVQVGHNIAAKTWISVRLSVDCGGSMISGCYVAVGEYIKVTDHIEAGKGIEAGLSIDAQTIASGTRIFAGTTLSKCPSQQEMQIRAKLLKGKVAFGELVEPDLHWYFAPPFF